MIACSQCLFTLGEIYGAILLMMDNLQMQGLHWRQQLVLGAAPSLLFGIVSCVFLYRSPICLVQQGEYDEAKEVLSVMQRDNAAPTASVDFRVVLPPIHSQTLSEQMKHLYNSPLFPSTLILLYTGFVINFAYYGCLYAFPNLLPSMGGYSSVDLFVGALWGLPGIAFGCLALTILSRLSVLKIHLIAVCSSALMFLLGALSGDSALPHFVSRLGYYGLKFSVSLGCVVLYVYISELFPAMTTKGTLYSSSIRAAGTSIGFASGRIAAMLAPILFEKLQADTGSYCCFFIMIIGMVILDLALIDLLPFETFGTELWHSLTTNTKTYTPPASSSQAQSKTQPQTGVFPPAPHHSD
jgi:MFS family permease